MNHQKTAIIITVFLSLTFLSCSNSGNDNNVSLFTTMDKKHTGIDFVNRVEYTEEFNTYTYRNFYNGAGVAIGDINGDNLPDIYFCGNMTSNRLYINKDDFVFEDVTEKAGVSCGGSWSAGVSLADVNGDGLPDIYVCKSGRPDSDNRRNALFINNGDLTFTEKAREFGLDVLGLSNHASFFDYDRDGDLDCYLLNNSFQSVTEFDIRPGQREIRDTLGANKLFRNDGGRFTDVSEEAGIYGSKIGFGLGVSIGDVNCDGWQDIYVANDFFEKDYLYVNQGDGTFRECLEEQMREISLGSMGADIADLNNDGWPEIFVSEMTPEDMPRYRTKAVFEDWQRYRMKVRNGYYHQFPRNTLQLNNRNNSFSEIGRFSGVSATDWSWGALIFDMDNDGWKDIFVANGIYKDLLDRDFLDMYSDPSVMRTLIRTEEKAIMQLIDQIPSVSIPNYAFISNRDLTFTNKADDLGLGTPSWSNGAAYGDLDNDGDNDLVVNNVNMEPFIYRNNIYNNTNNNTNNNIYSNIYSKGKVPNFLSLKLEGAGNNAFATGATAKIYSDGIVLSQELIPCHGFQSTSDNRLLFGLGGIQEIDSLEIVWPDGFKSVIRELGINQMMTISEKDISVTGYVPGKVAVRTVFSVPSISTLPEFSHSENDFSDFDRQKLLFRMVSNEGPRIAVGDVNGDGLDDIYLPNAKDSPGSLKFQDKSGNFISRNGNLFLADKISEETDASFADVDNDGDKDLYITTGGNELPSSSSALGDRLYLNDGKGNFTKSGQQSITDIYVSNSCVKPADFDNDGDIDLFVGSRLVPFNYGLPVSSYILQNDGKGNFSIITPAPLKNIGMVTDMSWADMDNDGDQDMLIAGEWMPLKVLRNDGETFADVSSNVGLQDSEGMWHTIEAADLNNDGLTDFIIGNDGLNHRFRPGANTPMVMFVNDFDMNGAVEQIICWSDSTGTYPVALRDDLTNQIPSLRNRYVTYSDYAGVTIGDLFTENILKKSIRLYLHETRTSVLINRGSMKFEIKPLPHEAQLTPVYAIAADDFDRDGICDIVLGGNQYRAKPETGINDASYGLFLKGEGELKWRGLLPGESGLFVKGEIRDFETIKVKGRNILAIALNNNKMQYYEY